MGISVLELKVIEKEKGKRRESRGRYCIEND